MFLRLACYVWLADGSLARGAAFLTLAVLVELFSRTQPAAASSVSAPKASSFSMPACVCGCYHEGVGGITCLTARCAQQCMAPAAVQLCMHLLPMAPCKHLLQVVGWCKGKRYVVWGA
jgi:hypothetical protein